MSSNRVPAIRTARLHNSARPLRSQCVGIIPILLLALGLGGCALNSSGLPGGLPVPPGGGTLSFSRSTLINGIQGRTYTIWIPTTGGSGTLSTCSVIAGALPAGLSIAISADPPATAAVSFCKITGTITTVGGTNVGFTVQATDTAANTSSQTFSIFVRPEFAVTTPGPLLPGVIARTYGNPAAPDLKTPQPVVTSVSATVGSTPLTTCAFTIAGNPGFNLAPAPTAGNTCSLSSGATTLTASGPFNVTLAATDTDLMDTFAGQTTKIVVPKKTISTVAPLSLTVNAALAALTVVPDPATNDAVTGRSYGEAPLAAPTYSSTPAGGVGVLIFSVTVGTPPTGIACNQGTPTTMVCKTTAPTTVSGVTSTFTVQANDAGNAATPSGSVSLAKTLTVDAGISLTSVVPDPAAVTSTAVIGRQYGAPGGKTSPLYTFGGGLPGGYTISTTAIPAWMTCTPSPAAPASTTLSCDSGATTVAAGASTLTVNAVDSANLTTPSGSLTPGPDTRVITVNPKLDIALAQNSVTLTGGAPAVLIPGVSARTYARGAEATTGAVNYSGAGGLGSASYRWCISAGAEPGGFVDRTLAVAVSTTCSVAGSTLAPSITLEANPVTGAGLPTTYNFTVQLDDGGNNTTPDSIAAGLSSPQATQVVINAPLAVKLQTVPASPDPTLPAGQAVVGRTYGSPSVPAAPAKANVVYEVTGGLSAAAPPLYTISSSGTLTTDTNIACTAGSTTATCNSGGAGVTNTGGLNPSLTISATDTFNAATPAAAAPATKLDVWTVNSPIAFSLLPAPLLPASVVPNGVIPDGVVSRQYGKPLGANDLVFTAAGGLVTAAGFGLTGTATGTLVTNSGLVCSPSTSQVGATVSVTCNSGGGVSTLGGTATGKTLVMTFDDGGNSTTPAAPTFTDNAGYNNYSNTMHPALNLALQAGSPDPINANAFAVVGRKYGATPAQLPVVYEATFGLGSYTFTTSGTLLANSNICAVPVIAVTTLACKTVGAVSGTSTSGSLTVQVDDDTTNLVTPSGSDSVVKAYTVNPGISMTVSPDPADTTPGTGTTAVIGRAYGTSAGLLSPTYTAIDGLGIYTYTLSNPPGANITCTSGVIATSVCSSAGVTAAAPVSFDVTVTDDVGGSSLTTEPDLVGVTITKTFTVNPALAITTTTLRNGLVAFTYVPTGPGETFATNGGGLSGEVWVAPGVVSAPCPIPTGVLPPGLALAAGTGALTGVATSASPGGFDYNFQVCVHDSPNTTTPAGFALPPVNQGPLAGATDYVVNIMDTLAAVVEPGTETVEAINTTTNALAGSAAMPVGSVPTSVAITPNGRKAYVTLFGTDDVGVIDTITGAVTTIPGGLGSCVGPQGIAIGLPGGLPTAFVACSNGEVAVIDADLDLFVSSTGFGSGGAFYSVALTPDDSLVFVTDSTNNEVVVFDASSLVEFCPTPLCLTHFSAGVTTPHGIIISADGNRAYVAGTGSNDVIVLDAFAVTSGTFPTVAGPISTGLLSAPEAFAVTPDALGAHVYVTLSNTSEFAVFNDTLATPAMIGSPVALAPGLVPIGITIPPLLVVPGTGFRVYIAEFGSNAVAIRNDETVTPFGANAASPIALTGLATPRGIAHIPVPR